MKNPLIPMGAITGAPAKAEIDEVMHLYAEAGIEQFVIYPRSGCEIAYMSDGWIEVCRNIIEAAKREKIDIWFYDEFNWPSGTCRGKVMSENEEYFAASVFVEDGKCVVKRYNHYADVLNPDAVDCFIKNTHEVYYRHFGEYFGTVIKGMYTDEPDIWVCTRNGGKYPYTKNIENIYKDRFGRDLFEEMAAEVPSAQFKQDFMALMGELYRNNYLKKVNDWCVSHGILLTGHTMDESLICRGVRTTGNTISALRCFSLPGIDEISTKTSLYGAEWLTLGCAEAAIRTAGNGGMAEVFALGPADLPPARIEQMLWFMSMFKIDHYVLAVAALDARGNYEKGIYYNPMCYTNPWFDGYKDLSVSAKEAARYAKKSFTPQVVVRYPAKLATEVLFTEKEELINNRLCDMLRAMVVNQYQWQLIDEDEAVNDGAYLVEINESDEFSIGNIIADIEKKVKRNLYVLENGELAEDIMLRAYDDGSFLVLDTRDKNQSRELTVVYNGEKHNISLRGRGHFTTESKIANEVEIKALDDVHFNIALDSNNILRCVFNEEKSKFCFYAEEDIEGVRLAVRNYHIDGELRLDGEVVNPVNKCACLKKGLNELYLSTDAFDIKKGHHKITLSKPSNSEFYLPSCFICGDFAVDKENNLRKMPVTVPSGRLNENVLPQYSGAISFETEAEVPDRKCSIRFDSSELYTRLYINGEYLGGKWGTYCWEIPGKYLGERVKFKFVQYTSIGPVFGNIMDFATEKNPLRPDLAPGRYQKNGVSDVRFVEIAE